MISQDRLSDLLDEAIIDCYGEEEEFAGVFTTLDESLPFPLPGHHAGLPVSVLGLDGQASSLRRGIVARIRRDGHDYTAALADLTFGDLDESSAEWLAMHRWWASLG